MINEKMLNALNEQVKHEMESAYLYLSMANYFYSINLPGMASWMKAQAHEEQVHAMKFFKHIVERNEEVKLQQIGLLATKWDNVLAAWKAAYDHELFITGKIKDLMKLALETGDYSAMPLLNWFLDEQIEEEEQTLEVVNMLEMAGTSGGTLILADQGLGHRKPGEGSSFA